MENISFFLSLAFALTTLLAVFLFYCAVGKSKFFLTILLIWLVFQTIIGLSGFYKVTDTVPPRFLLLILPPLLAIVVLFFTAKGRHFIDNADPGLLSLVHIVRIPVELILFGLFLYKTIPQLMTFEGRNFDIVSGITAPLVFYFGFIKKKLPISFILIWNFICLGLLINIVTHAVLSAPFPFQQLAFDQPNIAVLHFPFVWLPGCIVPLVLFSHLITIRQLLRERGAKITADLNRSIVVPVEILK